MPRQELTDLSPWKNNDTGVLSTKEQTSNKCRHLTECDLKPAIHHPDGSSPVPPHFPSTFTTQAHLHASAGYPGHAKNKRSQWPLRQDLPPSQLFPNSPPRFVSSPHFGPDGSLIYSPQHLRSYLFFCYLLRFQWQKPRLIPRCSFPLL